VLAIEPHDGISFATCEGLLAMRNKLFQRSFLTLIPLVFPLLSLFFMLSCTQRPADETARSGKMTLAVDRQLGDIADSQTKMFSSYYPDAHLTVTPVSSNKSIKLLLNRSVRAALIGGKPEATEDSLFATKKPSLRREPVARDAIVCIVNSRNPSRKISLEELDALFTGSEKKGLTPLVTADDFRLQSIFASKMGKRRDDLKPWACTSDAELIRRVSADNNAVGLLFNSSPELTIETSKNKSHIRILSVSEKTRATPPYLPTQQHIYDGRYPLVVTVYYVYYAGDALAAGFGAWLGSAGQKAFERSSFAPVKLVERKIFLN
jgi:phosphate transport system substrate-binding protein